MPPYAAVDPGFCNHVKVIRLLRRKDGLAAIGLWTLCLAWSHAHTRNLPPVQQGTVPVEIAETYGGPEWHELADLLVEVGLWNQVEDGLWRFHDFREHQTMDVYEAKRRGGRQTANKRWGTPMFGDPEDSSASSSPIGELVAQPKESNGSASSQAVQAVHTREEELKTSSSSSSGPTDADPDRALDAPGQRDDVERICDHLADRVEQRYGKRPKVIKGWRTAARLMLDADGRTEQQVHAAIDWCQDNEFWSPNVRSVPKLREKYIQLRAQAARDQAGARKPSTTDARVRAGLELAEKYAAQERAALTRGDHDDEVADGTGAGEGSGVRRAHNR